MPRRAIGDRAMTDAERQRRHRERQRLARIEAWEAAKTSAEKALRDRITRLEKENLDLKLQVQFLALNSHYGERQKAAGAMSRETVGKITRCLRTDLGQPSDADRDEACKLFNAWRSETQKANR